MDFFLKMPFFGHVSDWRSGFEDRKQPYMTWFYSQYSFLKISRCKQQSEEHQTTLSCVLKWVGSRTVFKCVDKNFHGSCFYVIIYKGKTEGVLHPHPHYQKSLPKTEL